MAKNTKLWFGAALGILGGIFISQLISRKRRMPNAQDWQKILDDEIGHIEAAALIARAQQRYDELLSQRIIFDNRALQSHLDENILPGLALYQTWRAEGLEPETALAKMDAMYAAQYQDGSTKLARRNRMLAFIPGGFTTFKSLVRLTMKNGFPSPGWELNYIVDAPQNFGFDIRRCFYLDILTLYGAPELTPSFCKIDDYTMAVMPGEIRWKRSSTLGMGASHCDFRWEYVPLEAVE